MKVVWSSGAGPHLKLSASCHFHCTTAFLTCMSVYSWFPWPTDHPFPLFSLSQGPLGGYQSQSHARSVPKPSPHSCPIPCRQSLFIRFMLKQNIHIFFWTFSWTLAEWYRSQRMTSIYKTHLCVYVCAFVAGFHYASNTPGSMQSPTLKHEKTKSQTESCQDY